MATNVVRERLLVNGPVCTPSMRLDHIRVCKLCIRHHTARLFSIPVSSCAGSFPEQRLVIEPAAHCNTTRGNKKKTFSASYGEHVVSEDVIIVNTKDKQRCEDLYCKVHDPAQSFVLRSYTMHELRNQHVFIG